MITISHLAIGSTESL